MPSSKLRGKEQQMILLKKHLAMLRSSKLQYNCVFKSISMIQCFLLHPVSRAEKEPLEPWAAQPCQHQPCWTAEEKNCIKMQGNLCSVSVWFDSWFNFFVLTQRSVAGFCILCSQRADDLLFLYYYSWFQQPVSPRAEEECWWCVCAGYTHGTWLVSDLERKGVELLVRFHARWKCIQHATLRPARGKSVYRGVWNKNEHDVK